MAVPRSTSPRRRLVAVGVLLMLAVQLFAVVVSGLGARSSSVDVARDAIQRESDTVIESILRHLDPAEQSVEVTTRLLEADLLDQTDPGLERYLFTQLAVLPQMTGAFVGYPDGTFVFVSLEEDGFRSKRITVDGERSSEVRRYDSNFGLKSVETVFDDTYDPTARPWYNLASDSENLEWTDPYVFFSSQQPGVTASKAVRAAGEVVAVVGVDVELTGLSSFLDNLAVSDSGEAFVISGDKVIGAPTEFAEKTRVDEAGDLVLLTATELEIPTLDLDRTGNAQRVESGGSTDLVLQRTFPADQGLEWHVVVRAPETSFTAIASRQLWTALLITIGGGLIVLLATLVLLKVTKPINELQHQAHTDPLTGLANRRRLNDAGSMMAAELSDGDVLSVLSIDLDDFKALNDVHGHHIGDRALQAVADELQKHTRAADLVARLGGDEFVIVQRVHDVDGGLDRAQRILSAVSDRLSSELPHSSLGVTGGLTVSDNFVADFSVLLMESDTALISAKNDSKGMLQLSQRLVQNAL